jgi:hypothetical protein
MKQSLNLFFKQRYTGDINYFEDKRVISFQILKVTKGKPVFCDFPNL